MFSKLRGEFVDVVERPEEALGAWVWRFPRYDDEIKTGARLIVRDSETAVFMDAGRVADVFGPGAHTLEAGSLPVLAGLRGWRRGRRSPFKAEVYFVSAERLAGVEWDGAPVSVGDPEFGTVRVSARGSCDVRVADAARLLREMDGAASAETWLRERVGAAFAAAAAAAGVPVLDAAAHRDALGERLREPVARQLWSAGLDVPSFTVADLSLPPEVAEALEARAAKGGSGDAYTEDAADAVAAAMGHGAGPAAVATSGWYLGLDGHQVGPFGDEELRERAASGELTPETLVRRSGRGEWTAAGEVPELADVVASAPR